MSFIMSPNRQLVYNKTEFSLIKSIFSLTWIKLMFETLFPSGLAGANTFENSASFMNSSMFPGRWELGIKFFKWELTTKKEKKKRPYSRKTIFPLLVFKYSNRYGIKSTRQWNKNLISCIYIPSTLLERSKNLPTITHTSQKYFLYVTVFTKSIFLFLII